MPRSQAALLLSLVLLVPGAAAQEPVKPRLDLQGDPLPEGALARLGSARLRPRDGVAGLHFLPDGKTLLAVTQSASLHLWDAADGKELRWFRHDRPTEADARLQMEQQLGLRWLNAGLILRDSYQGQAGNPQQVVASADGRLVAFWDAGQVQLWDTIQGKRLRQWPAQIVNGTPALGFSPDGKALAVLEQGEDGNARVAVVDLDTGKAVTRLKLSNQIVPHLLTFSPDGKQLVAAAGPFVYFWDLKTGKRVRSYHAVNMVMGLAFAPGGRRFVTVANSGGAQLWDDTSLDEVNKVAMEDFPGLAVAFSPDGKTAVITGQNGGVRRWDTTGTTVTEFASVGQQVVKLAFSPDGKTLALAPQAGRVRLWDVDRDQERLAQPGTGEIVGGRFVEGGRTLSLLTGNQELLPVAADSYKPGKPRKPFGKTGPGQIIQSPDGRVVALLPAEGDQAQVTLRDPRTGREVSVLKEFENWPAWAEFSPDGQVVLIRDNAGQWRLWRVRDGQPLHRLGQDGDGRAAFSRNGRMVALHVQDRLTVWEVASGKKRGQFRVPPWVGGLGFSADGRSLFIGADDEIIRQWDVASGRVERAFVGHRGGIVSVEASPDGKYLATGSNDETVRLWDVRSGDEVAVLEGHRGPVRSVGFGSGGKTLVSVSDDGTAMVWDATGAISARRQTLRPVTPTLEKLWRDLGDADAQVAFQAIHALTREPREAVAMLGDRLRPAARVEPEAVARLLADLDSGGYGAREKAQKELEKLEGQAASVLKKALEGRPSPEVARRVKEVLERAEEPGGAEALRQARAVEALGMIDTPEARRLLERLAGGAPGARLTREARAILDASR